MPDEFHKWRSPGQTWGVLKEWAREMRKGATDPEGVLWERLRNRKMDGFKFRRQHSVGRFALDFYCPEAGLGVEVDGPIHNESVEEDALREKLLEADGIRLVRFSNEQVLNDLEWVIQGIAMEINKQKNEN